jgi:hypothetical protein
MTAGRYIELSWGDFGPAEFYPVRGHVSAEDFAAAVGTHIGDLVERLEPPVHRWGRWCQTAMSIREGWTGELRIYEARGRGCFPVTVGYR